MKVSGKFGWVVLVILTLAHPTHAQPADEEQLVNSALYGRLFDDPEGLQQSIREHARAIGQRVSQQGEEVTVAARIVFNRGQTPEMLESLTRQLDLDVARADTLYPDGDDGAIVTMSIGARELVVPGSPLARRLRAAMFRQEMRMGELVAPPPGTPPGPGQRVVLPDYRFYRAEVIGPLGSIQAGPRTQRQDQPD